MFKETSSTTSLASSTTSFNNDGCFSTLTKLFIKEAQFAQITRDEALNACSLVLADLQQDEKLGEYLFASLVENGVLVPSSKSIYLIHGVSEQGILINLTMCYSPLCKITTTACYSPCCPKRTFAKLHINDPESTIDEATADDFFSKIPRYILENLTVQERERQLAIEELINYEDNFLKQLIVIRDVYARPLLSSQTIIEESRRYSFHDTLFGNYHILANHHKKILRDLESTRDISHHNLFPDSNTIGQLLLKHFTRLKDPYIHYVTNHVFAKYQYTTEFNKNVSFANFIEHQEALERDFRMPLKGLLISPIVRMAKYDLLFNTILKNSEQDQRDILIELIALLVDILHNINEAIRNAEAEQRLIEIKFGLRVRRPSMRYESDLQQILPDDATLLYEGTVDLCKPPPLPTIPCQLLLFKNALFITRKRYIADGEEEYLLVDRPISLHMLRIGKISRSWRVPTRQPANILSSIRRQISGSGTYYHHRRCNSENNRVSTTASAMAQEATMADDGISIHSDDGSSSTYSAVYTLSGLKIRHRIRTIKKRIRQKNKTVPTFRSNTSSNIGNTIKKKNSNTSTFIDSPASNMISPLLKKSASYPSRVDSPRIIRSRLLQISNMADPNLTYLFECPNVDSRLLWKKKIRSALPDPDLGPFGLETICRSANYTSLQSVNGWYITGCGTIWCSLPFTTSDGRRATALGTHYGLWVAYSDGSELFKQILPHNCHQLELFDNRIILVRTYKPNRMLAAVIIDHIFPPSNSRVTTTNMSEAPGGMVSTTDNEYNLKECQLLHKSGVLYFAVGTLGGEPILCYLRRRRTGSVRLVLMFYRTEGGSSIPWFKKFREYKPLFIQPCDLKIIHDNVYIRSVTEGIEKVDILSWILGASSVSNNGSSSFQQSKYSYRIDLPVPYHTIHAHQVDDPALKTIGYVPLNQPGTGLICSAQSASPVADPEADCLQQEIEFETEAKSVVVSYPYLIAFSPNVIEIRHLETTALVQAIPGNKIRLLYVSYPDPDISTPVIHIAMLHAEEDQTKVHQLYLKEPISFDDE